MKIWAGKSHFNLNQITPEDYLLIQNYFKTATHQNHLTESQIQKLNTFGQQMQNKYQREQQFR